MWHFRLEIESWQRRSRTTLKPKRNIIKMQEDKSAIFQMRFPQKLWYLLNLRPDAILWGGTGRTILLNYRILRNYLQCNHSVFKTTNISSFVRQLNLYGFRKVTSHLQDPLCNSSNPYMHEYVHDYFQFGRPELLNKITRKALTMKRTFKPKNAYNNTDQLFCLTPLQKARHALRMALKKTAQDLLAQDSSKQFYSLKLECEDSQDDLHEDEESFEYDWLPSNNGNIVNPDTNNSPPEPDNLKNIVENNRSKATEQIYEQAKVDEGDTFRDANQGSLMTFKNESCQEHTDSFSTQFLSMPDLDTVPATAKSGIELLTEFNIDNDIDEGIIRKLEDNVHGSLNCVLPSISNDQSDEAVLSENNLNMDQYNGDWDQMFNDMMNRSANQECGSEFKELYSQITKTIDLLNS